MRKVQNHGDDRLKGYCVHCGGSNETVDHNPSRVFLDEPYPPDLPAGPACIACNNGFSTDEAYLACLVECAATGKLEPEDVERPKVAGLLRKFGRLRDEMHAARRVTSDGLIWQADVPRVKRIITKLARGHVAFEIEPRLDDPQTISFMPLHVMTEMDRQEFEEDATTIGVWPEVGSRALNRLLVSFDGDGSFVEKQTWLVVQDGRYRYRVTWDDGIVVRLVIREYLTAVVAWE